MSSRRGRTPTQQRVGRRLVGAGLAVVDVRAPVQAIQGPAAVQELAELDASFYAGVEIGDASHGVCLKSLEALALADDRGSDAKWHEAGAQRVASPHRSPGSGR